MIARFGAAASQGDSRAATPERNVGEEPRREKPQTPMMFSGIPRVWRGRKSKFWRARR